MSKKLAIQGHPTRGKEIIELLEMMGGINKNMLSAHIGDVLNPHVYFLDPDSSDNRIVWNYLLGLERDGRASDMMIFTLEEFLEKYPFKVGDKVTDLKTDKIAEVYKMHWSENNGCVYYDIKYPNNCGCQRRLMDLKPMDDVNDIYSISECKTIGQGTYAIKIADGYKFDSIDENGNIIIKPIKPKYPTTYDDCCNMLNADEFVEYELMTNFPKLINARNAYWKIAGEQMGLGKPWDPDWKNRKQKKYCIYYDMDNIQRGSWYYHNSILAFPTKEMRSVFYENFKDLIKQCKELL